MQTKTTNIFVSRNAANKSRAEKIEYCFVISTVTPKGTTAEVKRFKDEKEATRALNSIRHPKRVK